MNVLMVNTMFKMCSQHKHLFMFCEHEDDNGHFMVYLKSPSASLWSLSKLMTVCR